MYMLILLQTHCNICISCIYSMYLVYPGQIKIFIYYLFIYLRVGIHKSNLAIHRPQSGIAYKS